MAASRKTFIVGTGPGFEPDVRAGLEWLIRTVAASGRPGLVAVPTGHQFRHGDFVTVVGERAGAALSRGGAVRFEVGELYGATERTLSNSRWSGGPVLALWPDRRHLGRITDDPRTQDLCVVPAIYGEVAAWAEGSSAVDLTGQDRPRRSEIDPVVEQALKSLTIVVNLRTGLTHPRDKAAAVHALRILGNGNLRLDPGAVEAWAIANGWTADGAAQLRAVTEGVLAGRRFQVGASPWRRDILAHWQASRIDSP